MSLGEIREKTGTLLALGILLGSSTSLADRGGWKLQQAEVRESGQRAIIGWDGLTQVLCLATDVSAAEDGILIEFMPLPSMPKVAKGDAGSFDRLNKLLSKHRVGFPRSTRYDGRKAPREAGRAGFEIRFHEKIGAHDITILEVRSSAEFVEWIRKKASEVSPRAGELPELVEYLVEKYITVYGCPFFVFDVVTVTKEKKSVEPIIYTFRSKEVFYPLEISRTFSGSTSIDLFVFSQERLHQRPLERLGFRVSTVAEVNAGEMEEVMPELRELLGRSAALQMFRFEGELDGLRGNVSVGVRKEHVREYTEGEVRRIAVRGRVARLGTAVALGAVLTMVVLLPFSMIVAARKPRWGVRAAAGVFLGIPAGFWAGMLAWFLYGEAMLKRPDEAAVVGTVLAGMVMGFALVFFQLGLRRRWAFWGVVYVGSAGPIALLLALFARSEMLAGTTVLVCAFTGLFLFARGVVIVGDALAVRLGPGLGGAMSRLAARLRTLPGLWRRILAGVLIGIPAGVIAGYLCEAVYGLLFWPVRELGGAVFVTTPMAVFLACFRLGLGKHWPLWLPAYLGAAFPAAGILLAMHRNVYFSAALAAVLLVYAGLFMCAKILCRSAPDERPQDRG